MQSRRTGQTVPIHNNTTARVDVVETEDVGIKERLSMNVADVLFIFREEEVEALSLTQPFLSLRSVPKNNLLIDFEGIPKHPLLFLGEPVNVLYTSKIVDDVVKCFLVKHSTFFHHFVQLSVYTLHSTSSTRLLVNHSRIREHTFTNTTHQQGSALSRSQCCTVRDRKSTRLNSSHVRISYAVF